EREAAQGSLPHGDVAEALERIRTTTALSLFSEADFLIEAAPEDFDVKARVFAMLVEQCQPEAVLATNTSSISITRIAAAAGQPERVIGMHFMNPVPIMPLVEIIRGLRTSDRTAGETRRVAERLGKTPVEVSDFPGFVSNRVLMPMINEA